MQILDANLFLSSCGSSFISDRRSEDLQFTAVATLPRIGNQSESASSTIVDTVSISSEAQKTWHSSQEAVISGFSTVLSKEGNSTRLQLIETADARAKISSGASGQINSFTNASVGGALPQGWSVEFTSTTVHYESEQMRAFVRGSVITKDGREITFSLDLGLSREFSSVEQENISIRAVTIDPLVINFSGGLPGLSDAKFAFDINSDGSKELVYATASGSGFLAFDRNSDGRINNGSELFGPLTGASFSELSSLDSDQNGWIDENDGIFTKLSIWTKDDTGNDKLLTLKEAGVGALSVNAVASVFSLTDDANRLKGQVQNTGIYLSEQGKVGAMQQIDLAAEAMNKNLPDNEGVRSGNQAAELSRTKAFEMLTNMNRLAAAASWLADKSRDIRQSFKEYLVNARKGHGGTTYPGKILNPLEQMIKSLEDFLKAHSLKSREHQQSVRMRLDSGF